jgi:acetylornithine deacetylase/succinyl-diaminopimelate desuccinylase-like protein
MSYRLRRPTRARSLKDGDLGARSGPGDLGRAHAPDEWIGVDELVLGARAYARALCAWCELAG